MTRKMFRGVEKVHVKICEGELGKFGTKTEEVETKGRFRSSRSAGGGIWLGEKGEGFSGILERTAMQGGRE